MSARDWNLWPICMAGLLFFTTTPAFANYDSEFIQNKCTEFKDFKTTILGHPGSNTDNSTFPEVISVRQDKFFAPMFSGMPINEQHVSIDYAIALGDVMRCSGDSIFVQTYGREYYEYAANNGSIKAIDILGNLDDVETNVFHDAVWWAHKAASMGDDVGQYEYARYLEMIDSGELLKELPSGLEMLPNGDLKDTRVWTNSDLTFLSSEAKSTYVEILKNLGFYKIFISYDHQQLAHIVETLYGQIAQSASPFKQQAINALTRIRQARSELANAEAATARAQRVATPNISHAQNGSSPEELKGTICENPQDGNAKGACVIAYTGCMLVAMTKGTDEEAKLILRRCIQKMATQEKRAMDRRDAAVKREFGGKSDTQVAADLVDKKGSKEKGSPTRRQSRKTNARSEIHEQTDPNVTNDVDP